MPKTKFIKSKSGLLTGLIALDSAFFMSTNAGSVSSLTLMLGFLLLLVTTFLLINRLYAFGQKYGLILSNNPKKFTMLGTVLFGSILALQSIGQLTMRDLFIALPFALGIYAYLSYGRGKSRLQTT